MAGNYSHSGPNKNLPDCQCLKLDKDSEKESNDPFAKFMKNNTFDHIPLRNFIEAQRKGYKVNGSGSVLSHNGSDGDGCALSRDGSDGEGCGMQRINNYLIHLINQLENEDSCDKRDTGIIDLEIIDGEDKMESKEQGKLISKKIHGP